MSSSELLRRNLNQHIVKNSISKSQDKDIDVAVKLVIHALADTYPGLTFHHQKRLMLTDIITGLKTDHPQISAQFGEPFKTSFITPDGGFIYFLDGFGKKKIVLVAEVKRQGTNDKRRDEGLKKQAKGNAIERLGKNLIGIRAIFKTEGIIPFICFGSGCDFAYDSSILDRVLTMNDFFSLNQLHVTKDFRPFEPVSLFFREPDWSVEEMVELMGSVCSAALDYYRITPS